MFWPLSCNSLLEAMRELFRRFAKTTAELVGSPGAFLLGVGLTLAWGTAGPYFHYSDTWQLIINTGTGIGTFLIVFLIQNTQNRDAKVMHLKLDELIRAVQAARTELVQMEDLSDAELENLQKEFQSHRDHASASMEKIAASRERRRSTQVNPAGEQQETSEPKPKSW